MDHSKLNADELKGLKLLRKRIEAERILEELIKLSETKYISPYYIASINEGLGKKN